MSDYETAQRRRNIVVGAFVLLGLCALVWLIFKFGDLPTVVSKVGSFDVYVQFPSATGVQRDTPVRFCGYQVGRVTKVVAPRVRADLVTGKQYHQTLVVLSIHKRYGDIPSNVEVKLMTRGLGSSYIELAVDPESLPSPPLDPNRPETKYLVAGMLLQGSTGMTSEFFPADSQKKLDELIDGLKALIGNANDVIGDPDNKQNTKNILANLSEATKQATVTLEEFQAFAKAGTSVLQGADEKIDKVVAALVDTGQEIQDFADAGTETLKSFDEKAERLVVALVAASEELAKATSQVRVILAKVEQGEGTMARLLNDGKFYENLVENTEQLLRVFEEVRAFVAEARENGLRIKLK